MNDLVHYLIFTWGGEMSQSVFIKLNENEMRKCKLVAKEYADRAEKYKKDFTKGKSNNYDFKLMGAIGEVAVSKLLNIPWAKMDLNTRHGGDLGEIEVKSTSKENGDLIVPIDNNKTRPYVLCCVKNNWVEVVGFVWPNEIFTDSNEIKTQGLMRPSYIIKRNRLNHISLLMKNI